MAAVVRKTPGFKLGKKQLFLTNHTISMINRPNQAPNFATFKVPLRFTKFDLRDYLWNLYNVEVTKVRSFVAPGPVVNTLTENSQQRVRIHRGQSEKYMTVELAQPFAWPSLPGDLEPWNHRLWEARKAYSEEMAKQQMVTARNETIAPSKIKASSDRRLLAKQAAALLKGDAKWSNGEILDEKWETVLKAAEQDVPLEKVDEQSPVASEVTEIKGKHTGPKTSI
ncbi:mitochondrial 54S ribosomal protein YmL41 [Ceratocystis pirilliformis]|uniref:Large ribosomal subunit protein uL23m n=1 Tax=Ceratocystis pirilliformis TaxID=259994 RepID=A0ABR3YJG2_9PEZI